MKYFNASEFGASGTFDCDRICKFVDAEEHPPTMKTKRNKIKHIPGSDINFTDLLR